MMVVTLICMRQAVNYASCNERLCASLSLCTRHQARSSTAPVEEFDG